MSPIMIILIVIGSLGAIFIVLFAIILFPVFSEAKLKAQRTTTLTHFREIGSGLQLYLADWEDVLPHKFGTNADLSETIGQYLNPDDPSVLRTMNPNGGEILPNMELAAYEVLYISDDASRFVLLFETTEWPRLGGKVYGRADSSAKFEQRRTQLLATPPKRDNSKSP